jgi:NTE family protein
MGRLERRLQKMRFHMIDSSALASLERTETQVIAYRPFLELLREQGRGRAVDWLAAHRHDVGRRPTLDLKACFA